VPWTTRSSKKSPRQGVHRRQAIDLKLIDELGDEKTAVAWLVAQKTSRKICRFAITSSALGSAT